MEAHKILASTTALQTHSLRSQLTVAFRMFIPRLPRLS